MKKKVSIRYNRFNEEYIIIPISELELMKYICECNIEEPNRSEQSKKDLLRRQIIFKHILNIIKNYNKPINYITIKKEHALYKELFVPAKKIIDSNMIENAYKIASIEQNTKIINAINKLQEQIEHFKNRNHKEQKIDIELGLYIHYSDIAREYGQDVADYIWENDSFKNYIKKQNNTLPHEEDRHVFLYENGKIKEIDLPKPTPNIVKTKKRTIN